MGALSRQLQRHFAADAPEGIAALPSAPDLAIIATPPTPDLWAALAAGSLIYLGMLPFSVRSFRLLRREAEAMREAEEA